MTKKNVRIAGVVMIAILLLSAGSSRVTATDQPSAGNGAVKIDKWGSRLAPPVTRVEISASCNRG
jgi:hypothetical protein